MTSDVRAAVMHFNEGPSVEDLNFSFRKYGHAERFYVHFRAYELINATPGLSYRDMRVEKGPTFEIRFLVKGMITEANGISMQVYAVLPSRVWAPRGLAIESELERREGKALLSQIPYDFDACIDFGIKTRSGLIYFRPTELKRWMAQAAKNNNVIA